MQENDRPAKLKSPIQSVGVLRFGMVAVLTLTLAVAIGRTLRLSYEGGISGLTPYPAHALIVVGAAVVGALVLRLQETLEDPHVPTFAKSRRTVLVAIIAASAIPQDVVGNTAVQHPLVIAAVLWTGLLGLMIWQNPRLRRVHKLSTGLEGLMVTLGLQLICLELYFYDPLAQFTLIFGLFGTALGGALALKARMVRSGVVYSAATLYIIGAEIVFGMLWPVTASMQKTS